MKITMLGTGHGTTINLYNTCFVMENNKKYFLIDCGGGIELLNRLNKAEIDYKKIQHIFISHVHTDHILGLFWFFKKVGVDVIFKGLKTKIYIYCNNEVYNAIIDVSKHILPPKLMDAMYKVIDFKILSDGDKYKINGVEYTFFDTHARETLQYGFVCKVNKKNFAFLGDEPLKQDLYDKIRDYEYVMHEAFCLDSEANIYHPYEKSHSTAKSSAEVLEKLGIKNLILYHTEESHGKQRKKLYTSEAQKVFSGKVFVPNDLEVLDIE